MTIIIGIMLLIIGYGQHETGTIIAGWVTIGFTLGIGMLFGLGMLAQGIKGGSDIDA